MIHWQRYKGAVEAARIEAALRRRAAPVPFVLGDLAIDYDRLLLRTKSIQR